MPNETLPDALKEAYASAPSGVVILDTLELSHPSIPDDTVFIVNNQDGCTATLEDGVTNKDFIPMAFEVKLPPPGDKGVQELSIGMDNVDRFISDFFNKAKAYKEPVKATYRPYLNTDLTQPQLNPPLNLNVVDVNITSQKVVARATFADLINKKHPLQVYSRSRFPSLGGA